MAVADQIPAAASATSPRATNSNPVPASPVTRHCPRLLRLPHENLRHSSSYAGGPLLAPWRYMLLAPASRRRPSAGLSSRRAPAVDMKTICIDARPHGRVDGSDALRRALPGFQGRDDGRRSNPHRPPQGLSGRCSPQTRPWAGGSDGLGLARDRH